MYAFKGGDKDPQYTISKENNFILFTANFNGKEISKALSKANKCDKNTKLTLCVTDYIRENVTIMADSATARFNFVSSSTVNENLKITYKLSRIPADFNQLIVKNSMMHDINPKIKNTVTVHLGKKPKVYQLTVKKPFVEINL
jgi:hypothetical protein